ncbi:glycoside hydrolase family 3 N-terminal domain-containing protein [Campylobacter curvus]|uniref:glycoside hydrolase family 3 N-terminal domain-containing protein n=1 Tax=Campylobacter curvus TaxID=200 RepID=UPI00036C03C9|nr:glycoside hydrolase family 3 N-terminal domain-containing protein [Campylobacter curvus]QKF61351.1 glycosyl hydrolase, family 3 [Campylobacter curvus]UEB49665.1 glycoside hydrolase family 3 protein [Campylobacter curvus]
MKFKILATLCFLVLNLCAADVSLRAKASQMVMVGFNGTSTKDASVRAMLSDVGYERFGGVVLLGRNVKDKAQLQTLTKAIKDKNPKIFIAIDEEGGNVTRMKDASFGGPYPSAKEVAATLDIKQAAEIYEQMADELKQSGINVDLAPVVDLHDEASPIIGAKERAFSENASKVIFYANAFMDAFKRDGIITTLKHFPGHGDSKEDSHKSKSEVVLTKEALLPYRDAISTNRAKFIMVGHLYVKELDEANPATLSKKIIGDLLRGEFKYDGVVISDDMLMKGAGDGPLKEKIIKFINAGGDILLFSEFKIGERRTAELVVQYILDAINENKISKERIDESYKRIMALKAAL